LLPISSGGLSSVVEKEKKYVYAHFGKKEMEEKGSVIGCVLIFGARRRWRNAVARVMNEVGVGRVTFFVSLSL
jgi:hypothetical protein